MRFLVLLLLTSCASIIQGSEQTVNIKTASGAKADCELAGSESTKTVSLPAEIVVDRSYYPIKINCTGANGVQGSAEVLSDVSNWGYGGALLGTAIGAGVDTYTGASFEYPEEIIIELGMHKLLGENSLNSRN